MKVLITGANGQLGTALAKIFDQAILTDSSELDISSSQAVQNFDFNDIEAIINSAAFTAVDDCQKPDNLSKVWAINSQGPANLTQIASSRKIPIVHLSTDYVFDGTKSGEYLESDLFNPLSVYGASKASADYAVSSYEKHYIFRTSWVIGSGHNFVKIMQNLAEKGINPNVVDDQIGRLTFTDTLASAILFALENQIDFGTYNLTNSGPASSWFEIAQKVFQLSKSDPERVSPVSTEKYYAGQDLIAPRPKNSQLSLQKIEQSGFLTDDWRVKLEQYFD